MNMFQNVQVNRMETVQEQRAREAQNELRKKGNRELHSLRCALSLKLSVRWLHSWPGILVNTSRKEGYSVKPTPRMPALLLFCSRLHRTSGTSR